MHILPKQLSARIVHKIAADYRLKVPLIINLIALLGLVFIVFGISTILISGIVAIAILCVIFGILLILPRVALSTLLHSFQDIRYHIRDVIVDSVDWRGDETILDVGVGSGFTLFGCAEKLTTGQAIGIDVFDAHSGGGTADIFWKNAKLEGIENRVHLEIADARNMPFEDNHFDVIVSTSAFHHMGGGDARQKSANEIIRVLKPGGRILVYDLSMVLKELEQAMRDAGFVNMHCNEGSSALLKGDKPTT